MPPFHPSARQQLDHVAVSPSLQQAGQTDLRATRSSGLGSTREAAAVILGLATTMTFVNGTIIPVDGGSLF
jgi:NAD(P)-dependent dehydrogenase (short-subunit alcohol dehydrogenase family)